MAQIVRDRVKQLTTTTGTGNYTLSTAISKNYTFAQVCNVGDIFYGTVEAVDGNGVPTGDWETGLYTYSATNTLTRTSVHDSSNSGNAVNWPAGSKHVSINLTATMWRTVTNNGVKGLTPSAPSAPTPLGTKIALLGDSTTKGTLPTPGPMSTTGNTYYVSTTGSNSNTGLDKAHPFLTIAKAVSVMAEGDWCYVASGTYNETVSMPSTLNGTAAKPIRFISQTKWGAKIVSPGTGYTSAVKIAGDYIEFNGFEVTGGGAIGIEYAGSYGTVKRNKVHDIPVPNRDGYGGAGIAFTEYATETDGMIDGNIVYNIGQYGSSTAFNKAQGIYPSIPNVTVQNNIIYNVIAYGIDTAHAAYTGKILNNTIFACGQSVASGSNDGGGIVVEQATNTGTATAGFVVANNIIYGCTTGYGIHEEGTVGVNTYTNNMCNGNYVNYGTLIASTHQNNVSSAPGFVNYQANGSGDYRLASGSAAIGSGSALGATTDYNGNARPLNGTYDLGAYEYNTVAPTGIASPAPQETMMLSTYLSSNGYTVANFGVNGNSAEKMWGGTDGVNPALTTWLGAGLSTYDILIVNLCANDPSDQTTTEYETNLNSIVDAIRAAGKYVILQTPNQTDYDAIIAPYKTKLTAVATAKSVPVLDVYQFCVDYRAANSLSSVYKIVPDGSHPQQTFYDAIYAWVPTRIQEIVASAGGVTPPPTTADPRPVGVTDTYGPLLFREEFDSATLDSTKWTPNIWYEANNATKNWDITNSCLRIWPQLDSTGKWFNRAFSTDGKYYATYGYFEAKMKLCRGYGTWPAFWLFNHIGTDRPEIDIMEAYCGGKVVNSGSNWGTAGPECAPTNYASDVHNDASSSQGQRKMLENGGIALHKLNEVWHVYGCRWDSTGCQFYLDGTPLGSKVGSTALTRQMFILLDLWFGSSTSGLATGNPNAAGAPYQPPSGNTNSFLIDYVRHWKLTP